MVGKRSSLICDIHLAEGKGPFIGDPRGVARRAEQFLISEGIAEAVMMSAEFEFYLFSEADYSSEASEASYTLSPMNKHTECSFYHVCPPPLGNRACILLLGNIGKSRIEKLE